MKFTCDCGQVTWLGDIDPLPADKELVGKLVDETPDKDVELSQFPILCACGMRHLVITRTPEETKEVPEASSMFDNLSAPGKTLSWEEMSRRMGAWNDDAADEQEEEEKEAESRRHTAVMKAGKMFRCTVNEHFVKRWINDTFSYDEGTNKELIEQVALDMIRKTYEGYEIQSIDLTVPLNEEFKAYSIEIQERSEKMRRELEEQRQKEIEEAAGKEIAVAPGKCVSCVIPQTPPTPQTDDTDSE